MRNLRRHADALAQCRMRVNRLTDVHCIRTHLNRQSDLADHVARVRADHATAQDLAVAVAVGFGGVIKQQLGNAFIAAIGNRGVGCGPGEQALLDLDALRLGLNFGQADLDNFGIGVGHGRNDASFERCGWYPLINVPKNRHSFKPAIGPETLFDPKRSSGGAD
jgi:hypothetical protein